MNSTYSFPDGAQAKVHINLPSLVWELMASDISDFSDKEFKGGYSGFVNRIVTSYINEKRYPASIDEKLTDISETLRELSEKKDSYTDGQIKQIKSVLFENCRARILKEFDVPKDEGKKIDLSNSCRELVEEVGLQIDGKVPYIAEIFDSTSLFLRAILLDYSRQRYDIRCQIYNQENYNKIIQGISSNQSLRISFKNGENTVIIPYCIESDDYHVHSYLVGLYENSRDLNNIALRRLSSMKKVSYESRDMSLTNKEQLFIKKSIAEKKIAYLRDKSEEYIIKLTPNGEKIYRDITFQRPIHLLQSEEDKENHIYHFYSSKYHIKNYFRRFGADAVIISPQKVHDEILEEYEKAFEAYSLQPPL